MLRPSFNSCKSTNVKRFQSCVAASSCAPARVSRRTFLSPQQTTTNIDFHAHSNLHNLSRSRFSKVDNTDVQVIFSRSANKQGINQVTSVRACFVIEVALCVLVREVRCSTHHVHRLTDCCVPYRSIFGRVPCCTTASLAIIARQLHTNLHTHHNWPSRSSSTPSSSHPFGHALRNY